MPLKVPFTECSFCTLCTSSRLNLAVPIPPAPVADKYLNPGKLEEDTELAPLDLHRCDDCGHLQLLIVVDPDFLWSHFTFMTSHTPELVDHYSRLADKVVDNFLEESSGYILDVGSNDGTLLRQFQNKGFEVQGVDPAEEVAQHALNNGVPTEVGYMTIDFAEKLVARQGRACAVTATNVFAHADDLNGMVAAVKTVLAEDGVFVFEASYLIDIVENNLVGTIFHEHLSHHAVGPLVCFFQRHGMELVAVERNGIQGGAIVGYVKHAAHAQPPRQRPAALVERCGGHAVKLAVIAQHLAGGQPAVAPGVARDDSCPASPFFCVRISDN